MIRKIAVVLIAVFLAGCSVDRVGVLEDVMDRPLSAETEEAQRAAIAELGTLKHERPLTLLIEALSGEWLEEAGNELVYRGRRWDRKHPDVPKTDVNPVYAALGDVAKSQHIDWQIRAKATWAIGEIGAVGLNARRAKPFIEAAYAVNSAVVAEEMSMALDKIGVTSTNSEGEGPELLRDGETVDGYDPEERWEIGKVE